MLHYIQLQLLLWAHIVFNYLWLASRSRCGDRYYSLPTCQWNPALHAAEGIRLSSLKVVCVGLDNATEGDLDAHHSRPTLDVKKR